MPKRGRNLRVKKLRLGSDLGRFWFVFGGCRGGIFVDFVLGFVLGFVMGFIVGFVVGFVLGFVWGWKLELYWIEFG